MSCPATDACEASLADLRTIAALRTHLGQGDLLRRLFLSKRWSMMNPATKYHWARRPDDPAGLVREGTDPAWPALGLETVDVDDATGWFRLRVLPAGAGWVDVDASGRLFVAGGEARRRWMADKRLDLLSSRESMFLVSLWTASPWTATASDDLADVHPNAGVVVGPDGVLRVETAVARLPTLASLWDTSGGKGIEAMFGD